MGGAPGWRRFTGDREDSGLAKAAVLEVGNCDPDHHVLHRMLTQQFDVSVDRVMHVDEALEKLRHGDYALVLFNRLIFADHSPGIALLERAKADGSANGTPMMMISNFDEAQHQSVAAGGVPGFGKNAIFDDSTTEMLGKYLPAKG